MRLLYITRAQFIQNIMTSRYYYMLKIGPYRNLLQNTVYYILTPVMRASDASMLGLHACCLFSQDFNLQGSLPRVGHRAAKFQTKTEGSLLPTICPDGVCVIIQITVLTIAGVLVSRVQLSIPPVLVQVIIKRDREHHSKCFVDVWNAVSQDSDNSRCDWSIRLARSVKYGFPCGK